MLAGQYASVPVRVFIRKKDYIVLRCQQVWNEKELKRFGFNSRYPKTSMEFVHDYTNIRQER